MRCSFSLAHGAVLVGLLTAACGAGQGASDRGTARALVARGQLEEAVSLYDERKNPELLTAIAEALLEREALSGDEARVRAVFTELGLSGLRARPTLERLTEPTQPPLVRALALSSLVSLGDEAKREPLRALADAQAPEVADIAYAHLDPERDEARLREALDAPRAARRVSALTVLARSRAAPSEALRERLGLTLRSDPSPQARVLALSVLARAGELRWNTAALALRDDAEEVRVAAARFLARTDLARAQELLAPDPAASQAPESESSLEVLRELFGSDDERQQAEARERLWAALQAENFALRARAVHLLTGVPEAHLERGRLQERLRVESSPELVLSLALALGVSDPQARAALERLSERPTVAGAQAAAALARAGDAGALERLRAYRQAEAPAVRRVVALAFGRDLGRPAELRAMLTDPDASVRLRAASAILAAS